MRHSKYLARSLALLGIALGASGCDSSPADPFTTGPGNASVMGLVTSSAGAPVPNTSVRISCPDASPVMVSTDSTGHYGVNLSTSDHALDAGGGKVICRFNEPAVFPARVQKDVRLGFAQGPVLVALQFVNLQEQ